MAEYAEKLRELHERQFAFAAHLRDPDSNPAPNDIEERRMQIYRDLFFNNIVNFLGSNFPILTKILGEERWRALVRDYYRDHDSHTPLFPDMPKEFLAYLAQERENGKHTHDLPDPPFLYELAHYEWVEAGLMLAEDSAENPNINPEGDLLEYRPAPAAPAWLLRYHYPVNEIGVEQQPCMPSDQPINFLIFRNQNDKIIFLKLNQVSARLFELLQGNPTMTGRDALTLVAEELGHPQPAAVIENGLNILEQWREKGVILGTL